MYHVLCISCVSRRKFKKTYQKVKINVVKLAVLGVLFISGSIYLLAIQTISGINFKPIGFFNPIGGLFRLLPGLF
jgi:uncharacterized membrane protein YgdD (TMEM256/DUF423 family)